MKTIKHRRNTQGLLTEANKVCISLLWESSYQGMADIITVTTKRSCNDFCTASYKLNALVNIFDGRCRRGWQFFASCPSSQAKSESNNFSDYTKLQFNQLIRKKKKKKGEKTPGHFKCYLWRYPEWASFFTGMIHMNHHVGVLDILWSAEWVSVNTGILIYIPRKLVLLPMPYWIWMFLCSQNILH